MDVLVEWIMRYAYNELFVFLMMGIVGVPLPEDLMLSHAGLLVSKGYFQPFPIIATAFVGSVGGITVGSGVRNSILGLYRRILGFLKEIEYELGDRSIMVHFGWPLFSWLYRLSIEVMVLNIVRLPRHYPRFKFVIEFPSFLVASNKLLNSQG